MRKLVLAVGAAIMLVGAPARAAMPWNYQIVELDNGMDRAQVQTLLGKPDTSISTTCGGLVGQPRPCRVWWYGDFGGPGSSFGVMFQQADDGIWRVIDWKYRKGF
jgi:hypothetical protein